MKPAKAGKKLHLTTVKKDGHEHRAGRRRRGKSRSHDASRLAPATGKSDTNLAVALRLAAAGIAVFPCRPRDKVVGDQLKKAKSPLVRWRTESTTDQDIISGWWARWPRALPAIDLAKAGLLVIDNDRHDPEADGVEAFNQLAEQRTFDPQSHPVVRTPRNGQHIYFRQPPGSCIGNSRGLLPRGIDVKGSGGYVIAPGAVLPDGTAYIVAPDSRDLADLRDGTIPEVPDWLLDVLQDRRGPMDNPGQAKIATAPNVDGIRLPTESMPSARETAFASVALEGCAAELAKARRLGRNTTLNNVAYRMGRMVTRGWIEQAEVHRRLLDAAVRCGLVGEDGVNAVRATLASGLNAGLSVPHADLGERPAPDSDPDSSGNTPPAPFVLPVSWDGDIRPPLPSYLVRDLVLEGSVGLLVGESMAGKSFVAIHLAASIAAGVPFFTKAAKRGGTLIIAAEAGGTIPERVDAARLGLKTVLQDDGSHGIDLNRLPMATVSEVPDLSTDHGADSLIQTAQKVAEDMKNRFGIPLRLIAADTILAAFGLQNWNDPAETTRAMTVLKRLSNATGATVIGIHHHGKDLNRGAAGSFALTAAPDFIISVFRKVDEEGEVGRRWISLTKSRREITGWQCEFQLVEQRVGVDADGMDVRSAYVQPSEGTISRANRVSKGRSGGRSKAQRAFRSAITDAMGEFGRSEPEGGSGVKVNAVDVIKVRDTVPRLSQEEREASIRERRDCPVGTSTGRPLTGNRHRKSPPKV